MFRLSSFLAPENCARKLAQVTLTRSHYASFLFKKVVIGYVLEKSDLQSIVQPAAEFHDRNLPEIELVLFLPGFWYQKNVKRILCQKLASLNAALQYSDLPRLHGKLGRPAACLCGSWRLRVGQSPVVLYHIWA